jgi:hypothetical protein
MALSAPKKCNTTEAAPQVWVPKASVSIWENAVVGRYTSGTNQGYVDNIGAATNMEVVGVARHNAGTVPSGHTATFSAQLLVDELIIPMTFASGLTTAYRRQLIYGIDENTASLSPVGPPIGMIIEVDSTTVARCGIGPSYVAQAMAFAAILPAPVFRARGVVYNNQSDLTAFTVASDDGMTYVAGDRVLLVGQTTAAQCGLYVVGTVATGTAPLTRAPEMPVGMALPLGSIVEIGPSGTYYGNSTWKATATTTGGAVIGTNDPVFYPKTYKQTVTLASGTYTIGVGSTANPDEPLFLLSGAVVQISRNTHAGTLGTDGYEAPSASRVTGKAGTAVVVVNSINDNGGTGSSDSSTVDVTVTNW